MNKQNIPGNSSGNSRSVSSNQQDVHPDLELIVRRHQNTSYQKPIADYVDQALENIQQKKQQIGGGLILDSGCGTADSTLNLARQFPNDLIVGIDQSFDRLSKQKTTERENILLIRANLIDIWLQMAKQNWKLDRHYLLYPNPWPKKKHLQRRWHGHPIFPSLIKLGGELELRTNWKIYAEEFSLAIEYMTKQKNQPEEFTDNEDLTPFETKYKKSEQTLYCYRVGLLSA